jgi:putative transcriptional regulator
MTTIICHPDPATLMSFAAGTLAEPLAAVVAAHVDMCEACRCEVDDLDLVGALLLAEVAPGRGAVSRAPATLPVIARAEADVGPGRHADPSGRLPRRLAAAYQLSFDSIPWKRLGPGVWHHRLPLGAGGRGDLRLLKIGPGRVMPDHGHGGGELTLVLDGAYSDETGTFRRGDIQDIDESVEHTPVADRDTGCICLIASERPARFKGLVGRLIQPWTGM